MGMREEFERTNGRDHRRQPPKGNNYIDPMAQIDWESFQKGWNQSRDALVVTLPKPWAHYSIMGDATDPDMVLDHSVVIKALTEAGVTINTTTVSGSN